MAHYGCKCANGAAAVWNNLAIPWKVKPNYHTPQYFYSISKYTLEIIENRDSNRHLYTMFITH